MNRQSNYLQLLLAARGVLETSRAERSGNRVIGTLADLICRHLPAVGCAIYLQNSRGKLNRRGSSGVSGWPAVIDRDETGAALPPHFTASGNLLETPVRDTEGLQGLILVLGLPDSTFSHEQEEILRETAALLANTHLPDEPDDLPDTSSAPPSIVCGTPIAPGLARGRLELYTMHERVLAQPFAAELDPQIDLDRLETALAHTRTNIETAVASLEEELPEVASLIFTAHLMMLDDAQFAGAIRELVAEGEHPCDAVLAVASGLLAQFGNSTMLGIREKVSDIKDLARRLLANLLQLQNRQQVVGDIVVAEDLCPSDILRLKTDGVKAIVMVGGGTAGHVSLIAASLALAMVSITRQQATALADGQWVEVDGEKGTVSPGSEPVSGDREPQQEEGSLEIAPAKPQTHTADGTRIRLTANINLLSDASLSARVGAEGVGLYRTEFPFLLGEAPPSEQTQLEIYRSLTEAIPGRRIVIRTLDVGGDKALPYLNDNEEANPALGLRAIRFCFSHEEMFREQLRAILRAGADCPELGIMFPLISSLNDFRQARDILQQCLDHLAHENIKHCGSPQVGMMVEVPSVIPLISNFAQEADFLSIGTNDLTQYLMAADRTNHQVDAYRSHHHPALVRTLAAIAQGAQPRGDTLSICGEMAGDIQFTAFLLGIGLRRLSMNPRRIPEIQAHIEELKLTDCQAFARQVLQQTTIVDVERCFSERKQ